VVGIGARTALPSAVPPGSVRAGRSQGQGAPAQASPRAVLPLGVLTSLWALAALAALAAWLLLYGFVLSGYQEHSAQHALYAQLRSELALGVAPLGGLVKPGEPVALLRVPQAGINDVVSEGTTAGILERGPGLESDTPLPGQAGASVIMGRPTLFGGPFRHLDLLRPGDLLAVTTGQGTFHYRVEDVLYPGDPVPPALKAGQGRLVLTTTTGAGWRQLGVPDQFLYVDASLIGKPVGTPGGMPNAVPYNQEAMHGDSSALVPLVLWLQLLVLTVLALVLVRSRWSVWLTWLVGTSVVLAVVWVASEVGFQLLPNLI